MRYAVLDWDNTVKKGFTLFSWIDFLLTKGIINKAVECQLNILHKTYKEGKINHDSYADYAGRIYALGMKGFKEIDRRNLIEEYLKGDRFSFFPFSKSLFEVLKEKEIKPIIISGAPRYILNEYQETLGIYEIYAFCEESEEGICSGSVEYNYGIDKQKTLEMLVRKYDEYPIAGFGDSYSDIPLFRYSQKAFCIVGENNVHCLEDKLVMIETNTSEGKIRKLLEKELEDL